jgi:hypothetical protein
MTKDVVHTANYITSVVIKEDDTIEPSKNPIHCDRLSLRLIPLIVPVWPHRRRTVYFHKKALRGSSDSETKRRHKR